MLAFYHATRASETRMGRIMFYRIMKTNTASEEARCLELVQNLLRVFWARANRVVPLRADLVAGQLNRFELGVGDL